MASAKEAADPRTSLRRFRAAHGGAGAKIKPGFAADDDSDDEEGSLVAQRVSYKGRVRRRNVARQVAYEPEGGMPTGSGSGSAPWPIVTDEASTSVEGLGPTSLVESITASLDGAAPTGQPGDSDSDEDDDDYRSDSDSEDESSSWKPTQRPTGTSNGIGPSNTASDPLPASTTASLPDADATADAARAAQQKHHQEVETALIVVGCVAGLICIGIGIWFFIRRRARRNRDSESQSKLRHFKLPFLSSRNRAWEELTDEKLYGNEKDVGVSGSELLGYLPDKPTPAAAAPFPIQRHMAEEKGYQGDTFGHNTTFMRTTQTEVPYSPTESSLSSAFGNGTYIPPTPLHPPPRAQINPPPIPAIPDNEPAQRDTIYTQASEASTLPRFRTVSSWVRQQTRRKAEDVPEQGYGYMSPDEQQPRRVQWNVVRPEGVGFARG